MQQLHKAKFAKSINQAQQDNGSIKLRAALMLMLELRFKTVERYRIIPKRVPAGFGYFSSKIWSQT